MGENKRGIKGESMSLKKGPGGKKKGAIKMQGKAKLQNRNERQLKEEREKKKKKKQIINPAQQWRTEDGSDNRYKGEWRE